MDGERYLPRLDIDTDRYLTKLTHTVRPSLTFLPFCGQTTFQPKEGTRVEGLLGHSAKT
jgi:hypothetical protein